MIAFAIGDLHSGKPFNDPRILKWYADFGTVTEGVNVNRGVPLHSCTEEEFAKFYTPDRASAERAQSLKELNALQCLDMEAADIILRGSPESNGFSYLDINVLPCHFMETSIGAKENNIREDCVTDRDSVVKQLDKMTIFVYYNYGKFVHDSFGEASILKQSKIEKIRADEYSPHYYSSFIQNNELNDEADYIQWGQATSQEFQTLTIDSNPKPTIYNKWPTAEEPDNLYKFTGIEIQLGQDQTIIERKTYSTLEWLGDTGGLFEALKTIGSFLLGPISAFALRVELLTLVFRQAPSAKTDPKPQTLNALQSGKGMECFSKSAEHFEKQGYLANLLNCNKRSRYLKLLDKASRAIDKELDLVKFFEQRRMQTFAILAILSTPQRLITQKMSISLLHESSSGEESSDLDRQSLNEAEMIDANYQAWKILNNGENKNRRMLRLQKLGENHRG